MLFIYYPKCSTCKNAKKYLDSKNIKYEERDIVKENPTYEELYSWYKNNDIELKKFFNTSGLVYKEMNLKDKLRDMSEEEQLKLLSSNGMLVKRPILINNNKIILGFSEEKYSEI